MATIFKFQSRMISEEDHSSLIFQTKTVMIPGGLSKRFLRPLQWLRPKGDGKSDAKSHRRGDQCISSLEKRRSSSLHARTALEQDSATLRPFSVKMLSNCLTASSRSLRRWISRFSARSAASSFASTPHSLRVRCFAAAHPPARVVSRLK